MSSIKNKLKSKFDKKDNYNQILSKIESKNNKKIIKVFKYAVVPICLIVFIGIMLLINNYRNIKTFKTDDSKNEILINKDNIVTADIDGKRVDVTKNELEKDQSNHLHWDKVKEIYNTLTARFYEEIKIPQELNYISTYLVYTRSQEPDGYAGAEYDTFHDYNIIYYSDPVNTDGYETIHKEVVIAISKDYQPLREYYFVDQDHLKISTINDVALKIVSYNEIYMITFSYKDLNLDIETRGISEREVIDLLESIIK